MSDRHPLRVEIQSRYRPLELRTVIRRALRQAAATEGVGGTVSVLVCDDEEIRGYNQRFAGVDSATDVLSFATGDGALAGAGELGDIVLSLDHVRAQARSAGHPDAREMATLAVHGFLHLLGYDHATRAEERRMFGRTEEILRAAGL